MPEIVPEGHKRCKRCGDVKPLEQFPISRGSRYNPCKACKAVYQAAYYQRNKERLNEYGREWRERNLEQVVERDRAYYEADRDAILAHKRVYNDATREQRKEKGRAYYEKNRELKQEQQREYYRRNKAAHLARNHQRRALLNDAEGSHTFEEVWQMYEDQEGLCAYCETPLFGTFHVDHMIPLTRKGSNDWTNLAITCPRCNRSKRASDPVEFMERIRAAS